MVWAPLEGTIQWSLRPYGSGIRRFELLVLAPRQIDWEYFNDELEIGDDIYRYIKLLDLKEFEDTEPYAYRYLTLEFFSIVARHENGKYLTARLKGTKYNITDKVLRDIYKLDSSIATRHSPMGYKIDPHWAIISPCETYKKSGPSLGLISDLAHVVIHKYISQMIYGKESNKVSEQQVFILWSISHDKPVTMLQYLKDTLFDIRNDTRRGPNLGHVVSKLAEYFGVDIDEPPIQGPLARRLPDQPTHPKLVTKRSSYKAYCEEMGIPYPDDESQPAAGTSAGPADENSHDEDGNDSDADRHSVHETIQSPPSIDAHTGASFQSAAPVWFFEYEARNEDVG
ncbi:grand meiotic recombination cluster protein 2 [Striga asiatica]|uniref:Grand meiotic recombination cluster protein 2 n=1 Tax=Striga asiatica TaxID=4170 RepID=A0A5A7QGR3_STRAF|nr:grand meiotic recombination cluster protein 2 [Striga asiatica]